MQEGTTVVERERLDLREIRQILSEAEGAQIRGKDCFRAVGVQFTSEGQVMRKDSYRVERVHHRDSDLERQTSERPSQRATAERRMNACMS